MDNVLDVSSLHRSSTLFIVRILYQSLPQCLWPLLLLIMHALCFDAHHLGSGRILPAEHPHEDELHHVAVKEKELCSSVSLRAVDRLHAACWGRRGVGEEDVFEGTELAAVSGLPLGRTEERYGDKGTEGGRLTRKKALAKNVYVKTVHPTHPPVPLPRFKISATTNVTMTPTNLYPEYATRSRSWLSLLMLSMYVPNLSPSISTATMAKAAVAVRPMTSGWNAPRRPANSVERSMYVTNAMTGMYMSGEFRSSRGGRK